MLSVGRLRIHSSFFICFVLVAALGWFKPFFLIISAVTAHELAHVAAAYAFGLRTSAVLITPIGESAQIEGFYTLGAWKKSVVLLAGPLANIVTTLFIFSFNGRQNETALQLAGICLALGVFNLLPVYPLDGGRLLFVYLGNRLGVLNSMKYIRLLTKTGIALLIISGTAQLVLFPFNISLLAIGLFLAAIYKRERMSMALSYYSCMMGKPARPHMKLKPAVFPGTCTVAEVERMFAWDFSLLIFVTAESGKISGVLTERRVFEASISSAEGRELKLLDIADMFGI